MLIFFLLLRNLYRYRSICYNFIVDLAKRMSWRVVRDMVDSSMIIRRLERLIYTLVHYSSRNVRVVRFVCARVGGYERRLLHPARYRTSGSSQSCMQYRMTCRVLLEEKTAQRWGMGENNIFPCLSCDFVSSVLDKELICRYSSWSSSSCSCWGDRLQKPNSPSFQIGSGWNFAGLFLE